MFKTQRTLLAASVVVAMTALTGCGSSSSDNGEKEVTLPVNAAPTAIALSASELTENAAATVVGALTTTDADTGETFSYTVSDARFEVVNSELKLKAGESVDFETEASLALTVTVTDSASNTFSQEFSLTVADVVEAPATYTFTSQFNDNSSVSYSGQIARHVLILELNSYIGSGLKADVDNGMITSKADAVAKLASFYDIADWDSEYVDRALALTTTPDTLQTTYGNFSSSSKALKGKIAGQDKTGQHEDWTTELTGWNDKGSVTPDELVLALFDAIGDNVQTYIDGTVRVDMVGNPINALYVNNNGVDLKQMVQKFLLGALAFSQGADDYLDDTEAGKGLLADNTIGDKDGAKDYTALEHAWDEGFGYFGAARNFNEYTDNEAAGKVKTEDDGRLDWNLYHDTNGDGSIDLNAEYNFGNSVNAAKRDRGTAGGAAPTDFTKTAFDAFVMGRAIITQAGGALDDTQMAALKEQRDIAVDAWEKAIAATAVHYINDVIGDLEKLGTAEYSASDYSDLAKHWSELKGFALSFQFNPRSPISDESFASLHSYIGMQPVLTAQHVEGIAGYKSKLLTARNLLQDAYGFDAENVAGW